MFLSYLIFSLVLKGRVEQTQLRVLVSVARLRELKALMSSNQFYTWCEDSILMKDERQQKRGFSLSREITKSWAKWWSLRTSDKLTGKDKQ